MFGRKEGWSRNTRVRRWNNTTGITTRGEIRPMNVVPVIASNRIGSPHIRSLHT